MEVGTLGAPGAGGVSVAAGGVGSSEAVVVGADVWCGDG